MTDQEIEDACRALAAFWKSGAQRHQRLGQLVLNLARPECEDYSLLSYQDGVHREKADWVDTVWGLDTREFVRRMSGE